MQLYAIDQVSISSVRSESLRPGEKFTVSAALGEELLKKLPHAVSLERPALKEPPASAQSVFDKLADRLAAAEDDADEKIAAIAATIVKAQADADEKLKTIAGTVTIAQTDADEKITAIAGSVALAQADADEKIAAIAATITAAQADADAKIADLAEKAGAADAKGKAEAGAPKNKMEQPPANKQGD